MKALLLKDYGHLVYEDVPVPAIGPEEVLVAVQACGICGSDVHGMDGSTGRRQPPIIMGHEASGVITQTGSSVKYWKPDDRVTFDSTIFCGHCEYCRHGEVNICDNRRVLGVSCNEYRQHGAFAEFVAVTHRILYRLPAGLPFEQAALVEPFSIALHALRQAPPSLNDTVVVIGAGMIGLALVQALSHTGCGQLFAVDLAAERLALASKCGATRVINSAMENPMDVINAATKGRGVDLAFEAVGLTATVDLAVRCVRKGGAVTLVGNIAPKIEFPLQVAVTRELTVHGSCASRGEYPVCLEMLDRGALNARTVITAVVPLAEGATWFDRLYRKDPGLLKVVLTPA